jgi:hypothetical protein
MRPRRRAVNSTDHRVTSKNRLFDRIDPYGHDFASFQPSRNAILSSPKTWETVLLQVRILKGFWKSRIVNDDHARKNPFD